MAIGLRRRRLPSRRQENDYPNQHGKHQVRIGQPKRQKALRLLWASRPTNANALLTGPAKAVRCDASKGNTHSGQAVKHLRPLRVSEEPADGFRRQACSEHVVASHGSRLRRMDRATGRSAAIRSEISVRPSHVCFISLGRPFTGGQQGRDTHLYLAETLKTRPAGLVVGCSLLPTERPSGDDIRLGGRAAP